MDNDIAIEVKDLHKEFLLPQHRITSLKQAFVNIGKKNIKKRQKVLEGINFQVNKGDFFGIVGRNGSGKSTLLKILAGVYTPTSGGAIINGNLTPFIELGVGFNPELSGRDNVFLNSALLGFSHKQTAMLYDEIVDFAELHEFMDKKLKNYSSGMQVRLAFAIAVKARNDILIFDEVLAVGDEAFQRKCLDIFEQYKAQKQTVILVTHDMSTVRKFCNRALLLNDGKISEIGDPRKVAQSYSKINEESIDRAVASEDSKSSQAKYLRAKILGSDNLPRQRFKVSETMKVHVSWDGLDSSKIESIGVNIFKKSGEHIVGLNSRNSKLDHWKQKGEIALDIDLNITSGKYYLFIEAFKEPGKVIDTIFEGPQFSIGESSEIMWSGLVYLPHKWVDGS